MTQARRSSRRKSRKAALALGAAGVSLAMTGAASATAPTTNVPLEDNARRFILAEEEISDVSLATFQVFDRENPPLSQGIRVARGGGCGGCGCGHGGGGGGGCAHAGFGGGGGALMPVSVAAALVPVSAAPAPALAVVPSAAVPRVAVALSVAVPLVAAAPVEEAALVLGHS